MSVKFDIQSLDEVLQGVGTVGITGHVRPDGDCVGSTLGLYNYIVANYPDIRAQVYLEPFEKHFDFLSGSDKVAHDTDGTTEPYDLFFVMDLGDLDRTANFVRPYIKKARKVVNVDHHINGHDFADLYYYDTEISSACELFYGLLEEDKVTKEVAECLYTGIIHDTGVLKYQATTPRTMEIAGKLMAKGIDFTAIIDDTFFRKSYAQNILLGKALMESRLFLDGKVIASHIDYRTMREYKVTGKELGGIIDQLRFTEGVEVAIFTYELADHSTKISTRSVNYVDVNKVCNALGGGGHVRAAGATVAMDYEAATAKLVELVKEQIHSC